MEARPKVLDLFAGCGGLSKGFEKAGFDIVAANEFWEPAGKTYVKNHPNTRFFDGDITLEETKKAIFDFFKDKKCDVIIGGPPCQAYSNAGLRDPNDPRGRLFEEYVKIVKHLQPKVFVMENVKGILTMKHDRDDLTESEKKESSSIAELENERANLLLLRKQAKNNSKKFKFGVEEEQRLQDVKVKLKQLSMEKERFRELVTSKILRRFKEIGYAVKFRLLTAADYGVPQKRQRVIFIGTRYPVEIVHPLPTHCEKNAKTKSDLLPWVTVRKAIDDLKDKPEDLKSSHIFTEHNAKFLEKIRNTLPGESVFGGYSDAFFRNLPDEPSRTVKENHGGVLVHYEKDRVMTPRELARLQSFPDNFIFEGSKSMVLKQIGNAVPVGLAMAIGKSVMNLLEKIEN